MGEGEHLARDERETLGMRRTAVCRAGQSLCADAPTSPPHVAGRALEVEAVALAGTPDLHEQFLGRRGTVATICGAGGCVTRRSTDYGPDQRVHPNRIADLSAADFVFVCGLPLSAGLCKGTVEIEPPVHEADDRMRAEDQPRMTLPPTDLEAQP